MTAADIRKEVDKALRDFFEDMGACEVMDVGPILRHVRTLSAEDARTLLVDVAQSDEVMCARLVETLLSDLQDQPDDWWETLMQSPVLAELF